MSDEYIIIANRYRLGDMIGRGGMGDVYKGTDTHTTETVAIKRLHESIIADNPDIVDRFQREGEALRTLNHPNIVSILDTVEENGQHYLIMEYVSGGSLRDLIDEQSRLPIEAVLNVALDLCDALTRAHRLHIIHRDIKPDNVLLAEDGTPRLTDFGVAHLGGRSRLTQTGSVIGTYAYLSPEACNGEELDERTDIWSFGVMLFEMLAGRVPFNEQTTAAVLTAILTKPAPDLRRLRDNIPDRLLDLIYRMLEKDRARRISSVRRVGAEIEEIIRSIHTPFRDMATMVGALPPELGSRFETPTDEYDGIPAMVSSHGQTHGLSLYPGQMQQRYTPGGTPMTGEYTVVQQNKWPWLSLAIIATVIACAVVLIVGIIFGPDQFSDSGEGRDPGAAQNVTHVPGETTSDFTLLAVDPVDPGDYMILVANLEQIRASSSAETRDVSRFIVDDLTQTLDTNIPFSNLRVRAYPAVITTQEQALQVAETNHAAVIIWGTYTTADADLKIQVGDLSIFPYLNFDRDLLERTLNVNVRVTDERRESVAPYVLTVINNLVNADGDGYEALRTSAIFEALAVANATGTSTAMTSAEVTSSGVVGYVHRTNVVGSESAALDEIHAALAIDAANPLLLIQRAIIYQRQGDFDAARSDLLAAGRIGPANWTMPQLLMASMTEDESVLALFNEIVEKRPGDWLPHFFLGTIYYSLEDMIPDAFTLAKSHLDQAIALGPEASFPYIYSALLALHEGRVEDVGPVIDLILSDYPDPAAMERMIRATFSGDTLSPYVVTLSAFTNQVLGRQADVIAWTTTEEDAINGIADTHLMRGIAYCALGDYAAAETSFSTGLEIDPTFILLYLLRADARQRQDNTAGASVDFSAVAASDQSVALQTTTTAIKAGELDCGTFLSPDNPVFAQQTSIAQPTSPARDTLPAARTPIPLAAAVTPDPIAAVQPVEAGEYMVLVANIEPLANVTERDVARFIVDDLRFTLEESVAYARMRVRRYPAIITSAAEAEQIADATGATVIIWGNYTTEEVELQIQVGSTAAFPYNTFTRDDLAKTGNVRVRLTSERRESVAIQVINIVNLLNLADGDQFDYLLTMTIIDDLDVTSAEIVGNTLGAHLHRALATYFDDPASTVAELTAAIALDSGNALLYAYRAITQLRVDDVASAELDIQTARRLGPENWTTPLYFDVYGSPEDTHDEFMALITTRSDDWYPQFILGVIFYTDYNDPAAAKPYLEASIAAGPEANLPYVTAMLLDLRTGEITEAQTYANIILTQFPDPDLTNRAFSALYGDSPQAEEAMTGEYFAAGTNIVIGQYNDVIQIVDEVLAPFRDGPAYAALLSTPNNGLSDVFLLQGIAYCNIDDYENAAAAYTQAIAVSENYALAHLLRGQMRLLLDDAAGAETDFATAQAHTLGPAFDPWVEAAIAGDWTCENLFEYN
ncbi:MAG: protein kinase [Anaerolineae bacterium]|nr:protein kinase [Anaerolineae bacterium]